MNTDDNIETPREELLIDTLGQLLRLLKDAGVDTKRNIEAVDAAALLTFQIMGEFERRAIGKVDEELIFCNPDHPVEFVAD